MDDSDSSQQEQHQRPASFSHQGVDPLPDYKDDARTSTHAAVQGRKKEDEEGGRRVDSAPSIHSFISASVLMPDKAVCTSQEDKVSFSFTPKITIITIILLIIHQRMNLSLCCCEHLFNTHVLSRHACLPWGVCNVIQQAGIRVKKRHRFSGFPTGCDHMPQVTFPLVPLSPHQADHRDMRVSLNQTPNGGADFGFQARWDSTGARVKSVQPGKPGYVWSESSSSNTETILSVNVAHSCIAGALF